MYRVGIFSTGRGEGSRGLIRAIHEGIRSGHVPAEVAFVFSNREPGEFEPTDAFFELVRDCGFPLVTKSFRKFRAGLAKGADWRDSYDREVATLLQPYTPDSCVLAGYLLIFSPAMCQRFTFINLHPAAPGGPVGMWQEVIWQLIENKAQQSGNTIFHVTEELDRGPTVSFCTFPIVGPSFDAHWRDVQGRGAIELHQREGEKHPLFRAIREHGMERERPLVVETIKAFAEGRVQISGDRVLDAAGKFVHGIDLTNEIEAYLERAKR